LLDEKRQGGEGKRAVKDVFSSSAEATTQQIRDARKVKGGKKVKKREIPRPLLGSGEKKTY